MAVLFICTRLFFFAIAEFEVFNAFLEYIVIVLLFLDPPERTWGNWSLPPEKFEHECVRVENEQQITKTTYESSGRASRTNHRIASRIFLWVGMRLGSC